MNPISSIFPLFPILAIAAILTGTSAAQTGAENGRPAGGPPQGETGSYTAGNATRWPATANNNLAPGRQPQDILADAIELLERRTAVSAKIRQKVDSFGKQLTGFGSYREQRFGANRLVRLELKLDLGGQTSSYLQVCDGRYLWTHRKLLDDGKLSRLDVARAKEGLDQAERAGGSGRPDILPGLGGLPKLLRGLHRSFLFTSAEAGHLGKEERPVWRLVGSWTEDRLVELLPRQKKAIRSGEPANLSKLPRHVPDQVVLMLGQADGFPYLIEYRRRMPTEETRPDDSPSRAMVTMELFDAVLDVPVEANHFTYNPGKLKFNDRTDKFLESLGLEE